MFLAGGPGIRSSAGRPNTKMNMKFLDGLKFSNMPCNDPNGCFAGGWDVSAPWISNVEGSVHGYDPIFPPYDDFGKNVGDFENSSMPIMGDMGAFTEIAANMIGSTAYQFYYNSKGGDPRSIYDSGSFNCWDGASIILSLASAFGLSGYRQQGTWNGIGHAWAVVGGRTFDTTAFQDGYGWESPKVSGYTAPSAGPVVFKSISSDIPSSNNSSNQNEVSGSLEFNIIHSLKDIPVGMDKNEILAVIKSSFNDDELIKELVKNPDFLNILSAELTRLKYKVKRANG